MSAKGKTAVAEKLYMKTCNCRWLQDTWEFASEIASLPSPLPFLKSRVYTEVRTYECALRRASEGKVEKAEKEMFSQSFMYENINLCMIC